MCLYTHTILFFLLINTSLASLLCLCGKSFLQSQRARAFVTDHCLVARIWYFYHYDLASISGLKPKPHYWLEDSCLLEYTVAVILWFIKSIYLVFIPVPGTGFLKIREIFLKSDKDAFSWAGVHAMRHARSYIPNRRRGTAGWINLQWSIIPIYWKKESKSHSVVSDLLQPHGLDIQSMEFFRPDHWSR